MKTLKELDYDLWAIEANGRKRYFARIKATGEEAEVSLEAVSYTHLCKWGWDRTVAQDEKSKRSP